MVAKIVIEGITIVLQMYNGWMIRWKVISTNKWQLKLN